MNETEKEVLRTLEKVKTFCKYQGIICNNCIFLINNECELKKEPERWSIADIAKAMEERK